MAQELRRVDISSYPEPVELVREVTSSDEPAVLRAGDEDLALITCTDRVIVHARAFDEQRAKEIIFR